MWLLLLSSSLHHQWCCCCDCSSFTCFLYKPAMLIVIRCCRGHSFIFLKSKNGCKNYSDCLQEGEKGRITLILFRGVILKMKWIFFVLQFHLFLYSTDTQKTTTVVVSSFQLQPWFSQKYWFFFFFLHRLMIFN